LDILSLLRRFLLNLPLRETACAILREKELALLLILTTSEELEGNKPCGGFSPSKLSTSVFAE
jgi:hypothetical protein